MSKKQLTLVIKRALKVEVLVDAIIAAGYQLPRTKKTKNTKVSAVRFIDNHNGTVTDIHNGITWVKNPHTDLPDKFKERMTWKDALGACKDLNFVGHKWIIPAE